MLGLLVLVGLLVTHGVMIRRARVSELAPAAAVERFSLLVLISALAGAQLAGALALHGTGVLRRPSSLLSAEGSLPSSAAFAAALLSAGVYSWWIRSTRLRAWADLVGYSVPSGWLFARAGCALAHDHPGLRSTSWLAVSFPDGPRLDCGLLEWLFTPLWIGLVVVLGRKRRPEGLLSGASGAFYALLRFGLDFLRAGDLPGSDCRWAGLTAAQWLCLPLAIVCGYLVVTARRRAPVPGAEQRRSPSPGDQADAEG